MLKGTDVSGQGKGFETIERYTDLSGLELPKEGVALLECLSNLTANEMFEPEGAKERTVQAGIFVAGRRRGIRKTVPGFGDCHERYLF